MRRLLFIMLLLAGLPLPATLHAQATADQLNKLSLEALTARPSGGGGGGGYVRRDYRASYHRSYRSYGYSRVRVARARHYGGYRRSYSRAAYSRHAYSRAAYRSSPRVAYHRSSPRVTYHRSYRR